MLIVCLVLFVVVGLVYLAVYWYCLCCVRVVCCCCFVVVYGLFCWGWSIWGGGCWDRGWILFGYCYICGRVCVLLCLDRKCFFWRFVWFFLWNWIWVVLFCCFCWVSVWFGFVCGCCWVVGCCVWIWWCLVVCDRKWDVFLGFCGFGVGFFWGGWW